MLALLRLELVKLLRQLGVWREDGRAVRHAVHDVHDVLGLAGGAVLLQQAGDGLARAGDVLGHQLADRVLVLRVDDDQGAVAGRGGGGGGA